MGKHKEKRKYVRKMAKVGIACKQCKVWIPVGVRSVGQGLCAMTQKERDEGLCRSNCARIYHNAHKATKRKGPRTQICDQCGKAILNASGAQRRCSVEVGLSDCQKKAKLLALDGAAIVPWSGLRKQRACMRCQKSFLSDSPGNRICSRCAAINSQMGAGHEHRIAVNSEMAHN